MRFIGESIIDAINWTQDKLQGTRPEAEAVLFELLAEKKVRETADGYILMEDKKNGDDDDGHDLRLRTRKRSRFRFHQSRKAIHHQKQQMRAKLHAMNQNDAADDMLSSDDGEN